MKLQTEMRSVARRLGLIRLITRLRSLVPLHSEEGYETALREEMERAIRPGDVVWDVGANVGHYTEIFAQRVGATGLVCAFEPATACFEAMRTRTQPFPQVRPFNAALTEVDGDLTLHVADDPLAATHSLSSTVAPKGGAKLIVRGARGDSIVSTGEAPVPNVIKIDVEGFEEEVLRGCTDVLRSPSLRAVFIEVHFGLLDARGERHAPERIVEQLRRNGLNPKWLDASHVAAYRPAA